MDKQKKIMIGIPNTGLLNTNVVESLLEIQSIHTISFNFLKSSILYISRENIVKAALNSNADYIMFLDSDQTIQPDTIDRLVEHLNNGENIVTTLIFRKDPPFHPCIFSEQRVLENYQIALKFYDLESQDLSKPFYVANCGLGCAMINLEVFKKLPQPWFLPAPYSGEDFSFLYIATTGLGYKILCDPTINIGHIGFKNFNRKDHFDNIEKQNKLLNGSVTPEVYL